SVARFEIAEIAARGRFGFEGLAEPAGIVFYDGACGVENILRGAVVAFEANHAGSGKITRKAEKDGDVGAAPAVNGLVFVADDADVLFRAGEKAKEVVLDTIRVLIFVHMNVLESLLPAIPDRG